MKFKTLTIFFSITFIIHVSTFSQTQLGEDIKGEMFKDQFGSAAALSDDGTTLVVAARENDEYAINAGQVNLYNWSGEKWKHFALGIDGFYANSRLGWSVAMSADGKVVACGAPEFGEEKGYVIIRERVTGLLSKR